MSLSLRSLDEIRYALDQAAIVAATDHRGIITYATDKFCEIYGMPVGSEALRV